jgi:hypothetical protein
MPKTLEDSIRDAIDGIYQAWVEFDEASRLYDTILDRISGLQPPAEGMNVLDQRISDAFYRMWRAGEALDHAGVEYLRLKARLDAQVRAKAARFHGLGPRPWLRTPIQRRPAMIPFTPVPQPIQQASSGGRKSFLIPFGAFW